jgi:activating signal cointegrator complex subunit 1
MAFFLLGLMQKQYERVKLHVTLMNTLFRNNDTESETSRRKQKHRETFDATNILKVCIFQTCIIFMLAWSELVV